MNVLRILQNATEGLRTAKVNRLARSVWNTVAVFLFSTFRDNTWGVPTWQFLGRAFEPTAAGGADVEMAVGLALWYDTAENDDWTGQLKPVFIEQTHTATFDTNSDASGDDRIDLLCVKPTLVEVYEDDPNNPGSNLETWFKDSTDGTRYQKAEPQWERWDFQFTIVEGTADPAPSAPAAPAGYVAIAEVTRPNGQADVQSADINDVRPRAKMHPGGITMDSGAKLEFVEGATTRALELNSAGEVEVDDRLRTTYAYAQQLILKGGLGSIIKIEEAGDSIIPIYESDGIKLAQLEGANTGGGRARVEFDGGSSEWSDVGGGVNVNSVTHVAVNQFTVNFDNVGLGTPQVTQKAGDAPLVPMASDVSGAGDTIDVTVTLYAADDGAAAAAGDVANAVFQIAIT